VDGADEGHQVVSGCALKTGSCRFRRPTQVDAVHAAKLAPIAVRAELELPTISAGDLDATLAAHGLRALEAAVREVAEKLRACGVKPGSRPVCMLR